MSSHSAIAASSRFFLTDTTHFFFAPLNYENEKRKTKQNKMMDDVVNLVLWEMTPLQWIPGLLNRRAYLQVRRRRFFRTLSDIRLHGGVPCMRRYCPCRFLNDDERRDIDHRHDE
jgi:hypothetical protein